MTSLRRAAVIVGAVIVCAVLLVTGCASDRGDRAASSSTTTTTAAGGATTTSGADGREGGGGAAGSDPSVRLRRVASLDEPVAMAARHGSDLLYVAERGGRVRALASEGDRLVQVGGPVLDLSRKVETGYVEQGLLGLAFSPDGSRMFVDYVRRGGDDGITEVVSYDMAGDAVDTASATELFSLRQPNVNHNGGDLVVGPDGWLYVAVGDGGGQGDPEDHGQDLSSPFAKILRLRLDGSGREPFVTGVRNPWRFSFDPPTGDLWVADVGGSLREEIDHLPGGGPEEPGGRGANLGWSLEEGTRSTGKPGDRSGLVAPVAEFSHDDGWCSIVGGSVYRGSAVPGLAGWYVFGDHCLPELRALDPAHPRDSRVIADGMATLTSFGTDLRGELYALSLDGPIYRLEAP